MTRPSEVSAVEKPHIGGARVECAGDPIDVVNPATDAVIGQVAQCGPDDVDAAVSAATSAQQLWRNTPAWQRGVALHRWADLMIEHQEELAALDSASNGKPMRDARNDIVGAMRVTRFWAGMADKVWGEQIPVTPGHLHYTLREPVGVCAVIMPWNGPCPSVALGAAPAIACGNSVVLKPSELAPLSAGLLSELSVRAGMPAGLVNVVLGSASTGQLLTEHRGIASINFTGSVATGRRIAETAGRGLKKVVLELGGKSPNIVFADADLDEALNGSVWGVFYYSGQVCIAGTRLLVQRSIAQQFSERLVARAARVRVGDPKVEATHIGPVASQLQYDRILDYVASGRDEGAECAAGGGRPPDIGARGRYVAPTVLVGVTEHMRVAREEIFGPVVAVMPFDDEDEAIALANGTEYGLSSAVWTSDGQRMLRMADRLQAGTVFGNTMRVQDPALPLGGFKDSGIGNAHSYGAIEACTQLKRVSLRFDSSAPAPGWTDLR